MELTIEQALRLGIAAHKEGKLQNAEKLYRVILSSQPKHSDANHNLGVLAVEIGKIQEALPFFKLAIETNPKQAQFWLSYIDALIKLDQIDDANQIIQQSKAFGLKGEQIDRLELQVSNTIKSSSLPISSTSNPSKKQINGLIALYTQGKLQEAVVHGTVISSQFPNNHIIPNILGAIYSGLGQFKKAIDCYNKAIKLKPDFASAYNNLGNTLNELNKYEAAIASFNKAIELNPGHAETHYNLGNALNELDKYEEAITSFNKAIELNPGHAEAHNNLGNTLHELNKYEEAIASFNKAIELNPGYAEPHYNLGNTLHKLDKYAEAIISFNKAIELNPGHAEAHNNLGNTLNDSGNYQRSLINYNRALKLQPGLSEAWINMSVPLFILKTLDSSSDAYVSAIPKATRSLLVNREIAILKYKLNRNNSMTVCFFNELKEIMRETPNWSIKNPNKPNAKIGSPLASEPKRIFALKHYGRSGTGFLHSLIDNHSEVSTLPSIYFSEFFNHATWDEITNGGWNELVDRFIAMYPVLFDARAPDPVLARGGTRLYNMGKQEGMANVGENRDEYLSVNKELFRGSLTQHLSFYNNIDAYTFFKLVHVAYEVSQLGDDNKNCIFYHIHNPDIYTTLKFINLAPDAAWVVMVREPLQSCESWIRSEFNNNDYKGISTKISSMLFDIDDFIFQKQKSIGVRLEDLIQKPKKTMKALCKWMGIKEEANLYEMTAQGKKWWGDPSSPDFQKDGQPAFASSSIKREVGSIFSTRDQFILKTLFYPFRVNFNYVKEDFIKFKGDLETIRPMIDQMFDFEKAIVERQKINPTDFVKSGFYLYLRSSMIERWETLNKYCTYPNMLQPLEI